MIASAELTRERMLAAAVTAVQPGRVYLATRMRQPFERTASPVLLDLGLAHPCVMEALASSHSSANTCRTSELLGAVKTLLAMATAVRSRSYVVAAAMTSESGRFMASITDTLLSKAFVGSSFIALGSLDVVEIAFSKEGGAA